ncbi:ABC1 kinase family protein [Oceanobacillus bengalensis]|uniref:AarF/ABC1/UbiB kinase family protein n=1 Tax=Oceanobacillus bengalensis TaxID=1435466 RepID=A0A494YYY4_9BACI|nr:AarF/UbiB family protein [Oceanobacillus bengalensis]RKQ15421.1 AarF/ABC1/UbiB kinase family protein [Oceanobacillus bengalensis]
MKKLKYNLIYRCTIIVWLAMKIIFQIYLFHFRTSIWDEKTKVKWDNLLAKLAEEYRIKAEKLGGVLIKVGQFLSTRTDFMPEVFIKEMTELVDRVPPMPYEYAEELLEEQWGTSIATHVQAIKKDSIASASIGEVYHALLHDGTEVAIKVRRYRIDEIFHKDFIALRLVFWILKVFTAFGKKADLDALYRELIEVMDRELDFTQELTFGKYFQERYKENEHIRIPHYYEALSTKKVLVMEWMRGVKVTNRDFYKSHDIDIEQTTKAIFYFYMDQFLNPGKFHADPHAGNILIQEDGRIAIIDFGMIGEIKHKDIGHFKLLIQGFIIDNYDIVVDALDKMNFLLPHADKRKIKRMLMETIEMYSDGSFRNFDAKVMDQIGEEINMIMKDQAIQLPANYAYLIRAVSIVVGLIYSLNPALDIVKWAKPIIKDWFGRKSIAESVAKQYVKNATEPLLSYPRAILNFLESGERDRKWEKEKHFIQLRHQFYLLLEMLSFIMVVIGTIFFMNSFGTETTALFVIGIIIFAIFTVVLCITLIMHYRFIRSRRPGRCNHE